MMLKPIEKVYLGDSVYLEINEFSQIILTTDNGYGPSNTIILEEEVFKALSRYLNGAIL